MKITRTVTSTRTEEVTGPTRDLVLFVHHLMNAKRIELTRPVLTTEELVEIADVFYDSQHGED